MHTCVHVFFKGLEMGCQVIWPLGNQLSLWEGKKKKRKQVCLFLNSSPGRSVQAANTPFLPALGESSTSEGAGLPSFLVVFPLFKQTSSPTIKQLFFIPSVPSPHRAAEGILPLSGNKEAQLKRTGTRWIKHRKDTQHLGAECFPWQ